MPRSDARSALSADAWSATPIDVKRKNAMSPSRIAGTVISVSTSLPKNRVPSRPLPTVKFTLMNSGNCTDLAVPSHRGSSRPSATTISVMPMVATVRIRRGARKNRRRNRNSTRIPSTTEATRPVAAAR